MLERYIRNKNYLCFVESSLNWKKSLKQLFALFTTGMLLSYAFYFVIINESIKTSRMIFEDMTTETSRCVFEKESMNKSCLYIENKFKNDEEIIKARELLIANYNRNESYWNIDDFVEKELENTLNVKNYMFLKGDFDNKIGIEYKKSIGLNVTKEIEAREEWIKNFDKEAFLSEIKKSYDLIGESLERLLSPLSVIYQSILVFVFYKIFLFGLFLLRLKKEAQKAKDRKSVEEVMTELMPSDTAAFIVLFGLIASILF